MITLAINWSHVGMQVGYLLASLSILVILHEFGHYITAKWFKCRVEKFYLFFDPWFSIIKKKVGETEYGIGWLPLGGYVKIAGMVDESMDKEALKQPPKPWEFRSKPAWQRLIIMLGGVTVNILLAFFIYAMILFTWGESKLPVANVPYGIWCTDSLMLELGLRNGDKLIAVDGAPVQYFEEVPGKVLLGKVVSVERGGKRIDVAVPKDLVGQLMEKKGRSKGLIRKRLPLLIPYYDNEDTSYAKRAGLQGLDRIVMVDSTPVNFIDELQVYLEKKKKDTVKISFERKGQLQALPVPVDEFGKIGIGELPEEIYDSLGSLNLRSGNSDFLNLFRPEFAKRGTS